jgi:hypothetical protein
MNATEKFAPRVLVPDEQPKPWAFTGPRPTLEEMQQAVGGNIEFVRLGCVVMVCNEEGQLLELPWNRLASSIVGRPIVGTVLLIDSEDIQ